MSRLADVQFHFETVYNPDATFTVIAQGIVDGRREVLTETNDDLSAALASVDQRIRRLLAPFWT